VGINGTGIDARCTPHTFEGKTMEDAPRGRSTKENESGSTECDAKRNSGDSDPTSRGSREGVDVKHSIATRKGKVTAKTLANVNATKRKGIMKPGKASETLQTSSHLARVDTRSNPYTFEGNAVNTCVDVSEWEFGLYYMLADHTVAARSGFCAADSMDTHEKAICVNACECGVQWEGRTVNFILKENDALKAILNTFVKKYPTSNSFECIVECEGDMHEGSDGLSYMTCTVKMLRKDKKEINNRYTIQQTMLNIRESIQIETLLNHLEKERTNTSH
jgi:hypothetical protein